MGKHSRGAGCKTQEKQLPRETLVLISDGVAGEELLLLKELSVFFWAVESRAMSDTHTNIHKHMHRI